MGSLLTRKERRGKKRPTPPSLDIVLSKSERNLVQESCMHEILKGKLWLGNQYAAGFHDPMTGVLPLESLKVLRKNKITHILSCIPERPNNFEKDGIIYMSVAMSDTKHFDLLACLQKTNAFINKAINESKGCILVHCQMGQSRSAATVIGYLMKANQMSYSEAFNLVKSKRRFIGNSKLRFFEQLKLYEKILMKEDNTKTNVTSKETD